ncbi:MAG: hypothetical protein KKE84_03665 [Gammaproteobacteria bacterium]|nr:hypothetical protein [Gammaproteobacteria bacterium]
MSSEIFYELYRKLAGARSEPTKCLAVVDELAKVCRDSGKAASSTDELLADADNCLHEVAESSILFAAAVSRWLTVDEDVELAKALVHKASVRHLQQPAAESYGLSNIEETRAILTACRLCTLSAAPAVSLGWTLSLTISHPTSDKTRQAVEHLLQYHVDEFPWTTRQLLSSEDSPFKSLEKAHEALAALEEQEAWLEGLPKLREFAMTPEMRLTLSGLKRSEHRAIHRRSRETSVLAQIFTTQHFKYANKTAVEFVVGDKVQETTLEMSPYSLSVELPLSERTDPGSGAARRRGLWRGAPQ